MKKYIIYALVAFAFTLTSCDNSSKSSSPSDPMSPELGQNLPTKSANSATTQKYDISGGGIWNPCCNEIITITGTAHYTYKNGKYHFHITNLEGTDANGNTYTGKYGYNINDNFDGVGDDAYTQVYKSSMKSATGCSFSVKIHIHYKWDENGNLVMDKYEYEIICD